MKPGAKRISPRAGVSWAEGSRALALDAVSVVAGGISEKVS